MSLSLQQVNYSPPQKQLHNSLILLYERLGEIAAGQRHFGGFIEDGDLDEKFHLKLTTYPRIAMTFSPADCDALVRYASMNSADLLASTTTPLERLMAATLWKQSDLGKVGYIASGIVETVNSATGHLTNPQAPVFRQFGRHLSKPLSQPIVDQHSLRAYRYLLGSDLCDGRHIRNAVKAQEVKSYVKWVQALAEPSISGAHIDRMYEFDRSMFALGKATKSFIQAVIPRSK